LVIKAVAVSGDSQGWSDGLLALMLQAVAPPQSSCWLLTLASSAQFQVAWYSALACFSR
jgi:hypothetical protein